MNAHKSFRPFFYYFIALRTRLFQEKFFPYDLGPNLFSGTSSTKQDQPCLSTNSTASALVWKDRAAEMLDRGSALEPQPIVGFSHLSRVSNSIFHFFVFSIPLCIAFFAGRNTRTLRVTMCSSGTQASTAPSESWT